MHADQTLMFAAIALIVVAVTVAVTRTASRKTGLTSEANRATPPASDDDDTDGWFHEPLPFGSNFVARAIPFHMRLFRSAPGKLHDTEATAPTGARLVDLTGRYRNGSFQIPASGITIGRDPCFSDIVISDPRVSGRHAWIGFVDGKPVLRDLGSTNGTFLNGRHNLPVTEEALYSGDTILLGRHEGDQFRFEMTGTLPINEKYNFQYGGGR